MENHKRRGLEMLFRHYDGAFLTGQDQTLELEFEFNLRLASTLAFTGRVDRVAVERSGEIHVIDYKTSARGAESLALDKDVSLQLDAYGVWTLLEYANARGSNSSLTI